MNEVYEFLKKCETYYLATIENGKPRVRPFGTIDLFEGNLYIQTGKVKEVSKQMHTNPSIEICGFKDGEWIRVSCDAIEDDRVEARRHMLDVYPMLKEMYKEDDGNTEAFKLVNATATIYSFTSAPKIYKF